MEVVFAIIGALSLSLISAKWIQLYVVHSKNQREFVGNIVDKISNPYEFKDYCESIKKEPISQVALAALKSKGVFSDQIKAMNEVLLEYQQSFEKGTGYLSLLGNLSVLGGLFGAVSGMIKAFADSKGDSVLLQQGINNSMNSIYWGLGIALVSFFFYSIFSNRANVLHQDLDRSSMDIFVAMNPEK